MNNKIIIGIIVALVIIGGLVILSGRLGNKKSSESGNSLKQTGQNAQNAGGPAQGKPITEEIKTVNISSSGFDPKELTIKKGVKVIWVNRSGENVDIVPTNSYAPLTLGEFPNDSSVQLLFDKAGKYSYQNKLKPSQTGTVTVE